MLSVAVVVAGFRALRKPKRSPARNLALRARQGPWQRQLGAPRRINTGLSGRGLWHRKRHHDIRLESCDCLYVSGRGERTTVLATER